MLTSLPVPKSGWYWISMLFRWNALFDTYKVVFILYLLFLFSDVLIGWSVTFFFCCVWIYFCLVASFRMLLNYLCLELFLCSELVHGQRNKISTKTKEKWRKNKKKKHLNLFDSLHFLGFLKSNRQRLDGTHKTWIWQIDSIEYFMRCVTTTLHRKYTEKRKEKTNQ